MFKSTFTVLGFLALAGAAGANATLVQPETGALRVAGAEGPTDAAQQGEPSGMARYVVGDLTIAEPFSRATLPKAPVAGGFFTVTNTGAEQDRLIGAASAVADRLEVHEMAMDGDVMRMRQLKDGLAIPAGETVELKPGGYHIMFMGLNQPLVEGETVIVTLIFEKAGEVEVPFSVRAPNAKGHGAMKHGGMKHGAMNREQKALSPVAHLPLNAARPLAEKLIAGAHPPALRKVAT